MQGLGATRYVLKLGAMKLTYAYTHDSVLPHALANTSEHTYTRRLWQGHVMGA